MAGILLWCLAGVFAGVLFCALVSAIIVCSIADEADRHARHIDRIDREGGEGWE